MDKKHKAFTLVELIVAVTILIILSTIGIIWYSIQLPIIRDASRISNLASIAEWLEMYRTKYALPLPEDRININSNWNTIAYQWYAWIEVLEIVEFSDLWKDPKDDIYYSYYLTQDRVYFQLLWFLEENESLKTSKLDLFNKTHAEYIDYSERFPTVNWSMLGILTWTWDNLNIPVQEIAIWSIDITTTTTEYIAHFTDINNIAWTWAILWELKTVAEVWWKHCSWSWWIIVCEWENF